MKPWTHARCARTYVCAPSIPPVYDANGQETARSECSWNWIKSILCSRGSSVTPSASSWFRQCAWLVPPPSMSRRYPRKKSEIIPRDPDRCIWIGWKVVRLKWRIHWQTHREIPVSGRISSDRDDIDALLIPQRFETILFYFNIIIILLLIILLFIFLLLLIILFLFYFIFLFLGS